IELFNAEQTDVQIGGCKVRLANGSMLPLSDTLFLVPPQTYFVLLQDTIGYTLFPHLAMYRYKSIAAGSGFSLTNSGGTVVVLNAFDMISDSLLYHPGMHTVDKKEAMNHSLERISFSSPANEVGNWGSSPAAQGATPGLQNAITGKLGNIPPGVSISPNPFSPDNDGFEDEIEIRYGTMYNQVSINIRIFDDKGRPRKTLLRNHYANGSGVIRYDGRDDGGNALPLGMYIVLMDITDTASGQKKAYKQVLVSAREL
ncbi:MAG: gliding motility-associated C-terminal domain-containing protein, partial [Ignavibacteriales bacterium]|nr:gliding motility-associated C-terminal domain-containing protein [Ignavibacteriales bacterium]